LLSINIKRIFTTYNFICILIMSKNTSSNKINKSMEGSDKSLHEKEEEELELDLGLKDINTMLFAKAANKDPKLVVEYLCAFECFLF
jgi:hypothetical protein